MNIAGLKQSKFLTRADVSKPVLVTIKGVHQENVAKEGAPEEWKWAIEFEETDKPMILNSTNGQLIAQIIKSDETDNWPGHKVVLYDDPSVSFGGKLTGGIRVRAPRQPQVQPQAPTRPAPQPARAQQPRAQEEPQGVECEDTPF